MKLKEIAERINAHLKRIEADPQLNKEYKTGSMVLHHYWHAGAGVAGNRVSVCYVSFQGNSTMTKKRALQYLTWLDAGNVGQHWTEEAK